MASGNKIIGHIFHTHMDLEIYISSKTVTQGLCGSYDNNRNNDLFNRFTNKTVNGSIDVNTVISWR